MRQVKTLQLAIAVSLFACTTASSPSGRPTAPNSSAQSFSGFAIRSARLSDLGKLPPGSAYEAVELLGWSPLLHDRGGVPSVYVDGQFMGGIDALRALPFERINRMYLIHASTAMQVFGSDARRPDGVVIAVETKVGRGS
jgi:hypothetical protein